MHERIRGRGLAMQCGLPVEFMSQHEFASRRDAVECEQAALFALSEWRTHGEWIEPEAAPLVDPCA